MVPLDNDIKLWTNRSAGLMADNSFISRSTVQYRGLFVQGHMIYIVPRRQPRTIFMCPRTNKPLYCTVDREIKLLSAINPALLLVQSLDLIIQGGDNGIIPQKHRLTDQKL